LAKSLIEVSVMAATVSRTFTVPIIRGLLHELDSLFWLLPGLLRGA
jgi:hypothetical protein